MKLTGPIEINPRKCLDFNYISFILFPFSLSFSLPFSHLPLSNFAGNYNVLDEKERVQEEEDIGH